MGGRAVSLFLILRNQFLHADRVVLPQSSLFKSDGVHVYDGAFFVHVAIERINAAL